MQQPGCYRHKLFRACCKYHIQQVWEGEQCGSGLEGWLDQQSRLLPYHKTLPGAPFITLGCSYLLFSWCRSEQPQMVGSIVGIRGKRLRDTLCLLQNCIGCSRCHVALLFKKCFYYKMPCAVFNLESRKYSLHLSYVSITFWKQCVKVKLCTLSS